MLGHFNISSELCPDSLKVKLSFAPLCCLLCSAGVTGGLFLVQGRRTGPFCNPQKDRQRIHYYTAQATPTILLLRMASSDITSSLSIITLIPTHLISMNKTSFEQFCPIFSNIYQNDKNIRSGFPPTSDLIPPTSGSID